MHGLNTIPNDFRIKLIETTLNKKCMSYYYYDSDKELFQLHFNWFENSNDFICMLTKVIPFVYHLHSKHKLNESGFDTTVFMCWPDLRRIRPPMSLEDSFRCFGNAIFTGIRIPFNQSDNFISVYKNVLLELARNDDREPAPDNYKLYPILTFKNIHPAEYFNFTSFVEYYGEYWGELCDYTKMRNYLEEIYLGYDGPPIRSDVEDEEEQDEEQTTIKINTLESFH